MKVSKHLILVAFIVFLSSYSFAATENFIKDRKQFGKPIRTKMPPQLIIDGLQKELEANSPKWKTFWQTFVVEDDELKDEYVIIARSYEKPWSFSLANKDCPRPIDYDQLVQQSTTTGSPVRIDVLVGVKRKKSWFKYNVNVYEPMYDQWTNPCAVWSLPPGGLIKDNKFYKENYSLKAYSDNLKNMILEVVRGLEDWRPPKKPRLIPAIRGAGVESIGETSEDLLTEVEKKLPVEKQEKILKKKLKQRDKELRKLEKEAKKD